MSLNCVKIKVGHKAFTEHDLVQVLNDYEIVIIDPITKNCVFKFNPIWKDINQMFQCICMCMHVKYIKLKINLHQNP